MHDVDKMSNIYSMSEKVKVSKLFLTQIATTNPFSSSHMPMGQNRLLF